jgi:hypothetical protein
MYSIPAVARRSAICFTNSSCSSMAQDRVLVLPDTTIVEAFPCGVYNGGGDRAVSDGPHIVVVRLIWTI